MDLPWTFEFDPTAFMMVILIDIVLSGDNAIVIGMAAASLPPDLRKRAITYGIVVAVVARLVFAVLALYLLQITGLKLVGALLLFYVCWQMWRDIRATQKNEIPEQEAKAEGEEGEQGDSKADRKRFLRAIVTILIADLSMSLDNVLAVAGAARDNVAMLIFGLVLSIVLMAVGATLVSKLLEKHRWLAYIGLAVIFYVAVEMGYRGLLEVIA